MRRSGSLLPRRDGSDLFRLVLLSAAFGTIGPAPAGALASRPAKPPALDLSGRPQTGAASFYRPAASGRRPADGARPSPRAMTAASRSLPLGTKAKVTDLATGRSVRVTVTDRGPFAKRRVLDVSAPAASRLGMAKAGVAPVKVQPLREPAPAR